MLGTTLGSVETGNFSQIERDAFGSRVLQHDGNTALQQHSFFTGKPQVEGLGNVFLFRNYRPELGKWQTADPLGYPDGWNNLAYCNNGVTMAFDWLGGEIVTDAVGIDWFNPQWNSDVQMVLTYLSAVPEIREIIDELKNSEKIYTIKEDSENVMPATSTNYALSSAETHLQNSSYLHEKWGQFSFSEALLWEIMNAYALIILEDMQGEENYTMAKYTEFKRKLKPPDPFPYDGNNVIE